VEQGTWKLTALESDRLMAFDEWQLVVEGYGSVDRHIKQETQGTATTEEACRAMVALSWYQWAQNLRPHWETVLPYYG
jgi:hypothetical protein